MEITVRMTQRSQVTIPAAVRRLLGLQARDPVTFRIENGEVRLSPAAFTLETAYGSVPPIKSEIEEAIRSAKLDKANQTARELANS